MGLLEILMKPLLDAQREAGREEGRTAGKARFEAWKARQRAAGVEFVDDELSDDTPEHHPPTLRR